MKASHLKRTAQIKLDGHYTIHALAYLMISCVVGIASAMSVLPAAMSYYSNFSMVISSIISCIISLLSQIAFAGLMNMLLKTARNQPCSYSDLWFGFSHHPDKIIIIALVHLAVSYVLWIPINILFSNAYLQQSPELAVLSGGLFVIYLIVLVLFDLHFAPTYFLYLEAPEKSVKEIFGESYRMMKHNRMKYLYLKLSYIPMAFLGTVSSVGNLWVYPYQTLTSLLFFIEIREMDEK